MLTSGLREHICLVLQKCELNWSQYIWWSDGECFKELKPFQILDERTSTGGKKKKFPVAHSWSRKLKAAPHAISNCTSSTVHRIQNVSTQSNVKCHPSQDFQTIQLVRDSHPLSSSLLPKLVDSEQPVSAKRCRVGLILDVGLPISGFFGIHQKHQIITHWFSGFALTCCFYVLNIVFAQTHSLKYITASYSTWRLFLLVTRSMDMCKWTREAPKLKIWPTKCV